MSIITASIDVTKIPKDKIINGKKGKYINIAIIERKEGADQYGNTHFIKMQKPKDSQEPDIYLGNGKEYGQQPQQPPSQQPDFDVPF